MKASEPPGREFPRPPLPRSFSSDLCQRPETRRGLSIAEAEPQRCARWGQGLSTGLALAASAPSPGARSQFFAPGLESQRETVREAESGTPS